MPAQLDAPIKRALMNHLVQQRAMMKAFDSCTVRAAQQPCAAPHRLKNRRCILLIANLIRHDHIRRHRAYKHGH